MRFVLRLACLAPILAAPAAVNWYSTQPAAARRQLAEEDGAARALAAGYSIWTESDLHTLKLACLLQRPAADLLVLGGSRAFPISAAWFEGRRVFNAAVLLGDLDDAAGFFEAAVRAGRTPRAVLLEINPMLVHPVAEDRRALTADYQMALTRYGLRAPWRSFIRLFSIDGARQALAGPPDWGIWTEGIGNSRIAPDGSVYAPEWERRGAAEVERIVGERIGNLDWQERLWRQRSVPSDWSARLLNRFLDDAQSRGVRVTALFVPVHPAAYVAFHAKGGYDETWLRRELARKGIPVVGSYSPAPAAAQPWEFYDEVHPRPAVLRRILEHADLFGAVR